MCRECLSAFYNDLRGRVYSRAISFIIIYWGVKAAELSQTCVVAPAFPEWTEILMMVINNTIISPKTWKPSEHHLGVSAVTERDREECCCYDMTTSADRTHTHTQAAVWSDINCSSQQLHTQHSNLYTRFLEKNNNVHLHKRHCYSATVCCFGGC